MKESLITTGQGSDNKEVRPIENFGRALAASVGSSFIWDCFGAEVQRLGWMVFFEGSEKGGEEKVVVSGREQGEKK